MRCIQSSARLLCRSRASHFALPIQQPTSASDLICALKRCSMTRDLDLGEILHRHVQEQGHGSNVVVANGLVEMYGRCGDMEHAKNVFEKIKDKSAVTWTCLITGFVENGESLSALELFTSMDCQPDHVACLAAIKACARLARGGHMEQQNALETARSVHERIKWLALDSNIRVASALVDMYSRTGTMDLARAVFDEIETKDVVTWTSLILGYVNNGESSTALELFNTMDCEPNHFTYVAALKSCAGVASEKETERQNILRTSIAMHEQIKVRGYDSNILVSNILVEVYGKCHRMELARDVFDRMSSRTAATWNSLMLGYVESGESEVALEAFNCMDCELNEVSYVAVLKALAAMASVRDSVGKRTVLERGISVHQSIKARGFDSNVVVASMLVDMYSKCGDMSLGRETFERMTCKNVVAWNSLLLGYVENGESFTALELFASMDCEPTSVTMIAALKACAECKALEKGVEIHRKAKELSLDSNALVSNTLVDVYSKCKSMKLAREVFDRMTSKTVVAWSSLILGYVENEESSTALETFMSIECQPNQVTFVAALKACASLASLSQGRRIHASICRLGMEEDSCAATSLIDFYGRCGCMQTALEVFNGMHSPDVVSWSTLITGYSLLGDSSRVVGLAKELHEVGLRMNAVSLVCILTACSHLGMVKEAETYFSCCMEEHGVKPTVEHYTCMVDILARANKLEEAVEVIKRMGSAADEVTWTSLLDACRKSNNLEVAKAAFDSLVSSQETLSSAPFVLMRDIYKCGTVK